VPAGMESTSLVIGGTGMLAGASRWLAARSSVTLLVARHAGRFAETNPGFLPIDLDWSADGFVAALEESLRRVAPVSRALLWVHEAIAVLPALLPLLSSARVVVVLGSTDGAPGDLENRLNVATVRLGSAGAPGRRRWLTHDEICAGAILALQDGQSRIVGELKPVRSS
jgi:hypothetical protein